ILTCNLRLIFAQYYKLLLLFINYTTMKIKAIFSLLLTSFISAMGYAQHTYLTLGSEEVQLLERLETKSGSFSNQLFLTTKPISRASLVNYLTARKSEINDLHLTNADMYQLNRAVSLSGEWVAPNGDGAEESKYNLFNLIYKKQTDFIHYNSPNVFF